jgi:hypothetical protein
MRQHNTTPSHTPAAQKRLRDDLWQDAFIGHWPCEAWLEKFLDHVEAGR